MPLQITNGSKIYYPMSSVTALKGYQSEHMAITFPDYLLRSSSLRVFYQRLASPMVPRNFVAIAHDHLIQMTSGDLFEDRFLKTSKVDLSQVLLHLSSSVCW